MIKLGWICGAMMGLYLLRWVIWKRKEQPFALPLLFICLFLPKLKLVEISDLTTAGIRPDDFLALILLGIALLDPATYRNKKIRTGVALITVLSVLNLASVFIGRASGYGNNILLSLMMIVRKYEYGAFALVGIYIARRLKDPYRVFIREFTIMSAMHLIIGILHASHLATYIAAGYDLGDYYEGAAVSTFNGYYEYAQFLLFGVIIFLYDWLKHRNTVSLCMVPLSLGMLFLTESRFSLVLGFLLAAGMLLFPVRSRAGKRKLALGGPVVLGAAAGLAVLGTGVVGAELVGRFETVDLSEYFGNWSFFMHKGYLNLYRQIMTERVFEFQAIDILGYLDRITDWSAANRFMKWSSAWDGFKLHPVLGYGTGVTHVMDGNYIKLLGETGFLGTGLWMFIYGYFMRAVYKARRVSKIAVPVLLIMVSILLNSLLVDMFEASKPMEMMWFLVGAVIGTGALAKEKRNFS